MTGDGLVVGKLIKRITLRSVFDNQQRLTKEMLKSSANKSRKDAVEHWLVRLEGEDDNKPFSEHSFVKTVDESVGDILTNAETSSRTLLKTLPTKQCKIKNNPLLLGTETTISPVPRLKPVVTPVPPDDKNMVKNIIPSHHSSKGMTITTNNISSGGNNSSEVNNITTTRAVTADLRTPPVPTTTITNSRPKRSNESQLFMINQQSCETTTTTKNNHNKNNSGGGKNSKRDIKKNLQLRVNTRSSGHVLFSATDDVEPVIKQQRRSPRKRKAEAHGKLGKNGEEPSAIKITMNTGILYMYRGKRRWAKFVPTK